MGPKGTTVHKRATQDEPQEEPAIDQAPAEEEEEQDPGEWAAEEEYEEDEEVPNRGGRAGGEQRTCEC